MLFILIVNLIIKKKVCLQSLPSLPRPASGSISLQITFWRAVRNNSLGTEFRAAHFPFHQKKKKISPLSFLPLSSCWGQDGDGQPQHQLRLNTGRALLSSSLCSGASVPKRHCLGDQGDSLGTAGGELPWVMLVNHWQHDAFLCPTVWCSLCDYAAQSLLESIKLSSSILLCPQDLTLS